MHEVPDVDVQNLGSLKAQQDNVDNHDGWNSKDRERGCPAGAAQSSETDLGNIIARPHSRIVIERWLNSRKQEIDSEHNALEADAHKQARTQRLGGLHAKEQTQNEDDHRKHDRSAKTDEFLKEGKRDVHDMAP